ncbi:MAG: hypothetical protein H6696_14675 [Deferribacteres bacterium]|nr:hypothetical protein [candidate division KSB1 bacterium]MCB9503172.1 hypothetical protein [Deferribacteres bacterium]
MQILQGFSALQNIHPLFVHFPIALVMVTLLFEVIWWFSGKEPFRQFSTYLLYLATISAIAAVVTGYWASESLGHDAPGHEFVHEHRDVMFWMTGLLLATTVSVIFIEPLRSGKLRKLLILPLLVISGLLVNGADKGGVLVYEYGMGVNMKMEQHDATQPELQKAKPDKQDANTHIHSDGKEHKH